jgi:hypothetical protein
LTALLGFKFAPRISSSLDKNLYSYQALGDYGPLSTLLEGRCTGSPLTLHQNESREERLQSNRVNGRKAVREDLHRGKKRYPS